MVLLENAKRIARFAWDNQRKIKSAIGTAAGAYKWATGNNQPKMRRYISTGGGGGGGSARRYKRKRGRGKKPYGRQRKKSRGNMLIRQSNNQSSFTSVNVKYKKQKLSRGYKLISNLSQYTTTSPGYFGTVAGQTLARQYSATIGHWFNGTDYGALINTYFQNLESTDPYFGLIPTSGNLAMKTLIQGVRAQFQIINQTEAISLARIYIVMAKTTGTYEDPLTTWTNSIDSDSGNDSAVGPGTNPTINYPGSFPTEHKQFNLTWKVVSCKKIELQPGITHNHTFALNINRVIDYDYFSKFSMIKGITFAAFIVAQGTPGDTTRGPNPGLGMTVNYAPVKIDWILQNHYKFRVATKLPGNHYYQSTLGTKTLTDTTGLYQQNGVSGTGPVDLTQFTLFG